MNQLSYSRGVSSVPKSFTSASVHSPIGISRRSPTAFSSATIYRVQPTKSLLQFCQVLDGFGGGLTLPGSGSAADIGNNEKETMHHLNNRLANYLDKVRSLEEKNKDLERKIQKHSSGRSFQGFDWDAYELKVRPLQQQIKDLINENARLTLQIDNARLASDDFRNKWETEVVLCQSVQADLQGLQNIKKDYIPVLASLQNEVSSLQDERDYLKRNHEEEMEQLRKQATGTVNVEVDCTPGDDLNKVLDEMREEYENTVRQSRDEAEAWYKKQAEIHCLQTTQDTDALDAAKSELADLRRQFNNLQADLETTRGINVSLGNNLRDTEMQSGNDLRAYQQSIQKLEAELAQIRADIGQSSQDYQELLNIKVKLEKEIQTYRQLLEGAEQGSPASFGKDSSTKLK
ncbi:keratin, type I cytoskeletal 18-like [Protopterus annectens]|uniref:keratin, type I cytoskeletal 18-like n=1 Tax=Protopterus annectens TaxID=7888 RepID=UPI001CFBFFA0|nr:keratin, type I cytoskeletal 18-like [Protopterus annectens]